jgi:glycine/D-amino acid oxidase-like deaminating enzyme
VNRESEQLAGPLVWTVRRRLFFLDAVSYKEKVAQEFEAFQPEHLLHLNRFRAEFAPRRAHLVRTAVFNTRVSVGEVETVTTEDLHRTTLYAEIVELFPNLDALEMDVLPLPPSLKPTPLLGARLHPILTAFEFTGLGDHPASGALIAQALLSFPLLSTLALLYVDASDSPDFPAQSTYS